MKLEYLVTENDYISLLADMLRKNDRRPIKQFLFFMLTVGQMAIIAYMCAFKLDSSRWPFYIGWSIAVAALNILHRKTVRARAKGTLLRLKAGSQLPEDYWQPHKLKEGREGLELRYGEIRTLCTFGGLTNIEERNGLIYLYSGGNIFDIIPTETFKTANAKKEFLDWMHRFQMTDSTDLEPAAKYWDNSSEIKLQFTLKDSDFLNAQISAFRSLYLKYQFGKGSSLIRLAISVFAVVNFVMAPSTLNLLLSVVLLLILNTTNISVLTPLGRMRIRRELGEAWQNGGDIVLSIGDRGIWYRCGEELMLVPYDNINAIDETKTYRYLSWGRFPAIVIPKRVAVTTEAKVFFDEVADRRARIN